jgi:prevent-host-death family protein
MIRKGAEDARNQLPRLLEAAEEGQSTVITKRGRPVTALIPSTTTPPRFGRRRSSLWLGRVARSGAGIALGPFAN